MTAARRALRAAAARRPVAAAAAAGGSGGAASLSWLRMIRTEAAGAARTTLAASASIPHAAAAAAAAPTRAAAAAVSAVPAASAAEGPALARLDVALCAGTAGVDSWYQRLGGAKRHAQGRPCWRPSAPAMPIPAISSFGCGFVSRLAAPTVAAAARLSTAAAPAAAAGHAAPAVSSASNPTQPTPLQQQPGRDLGGDPLGDAISDALSSMRAAGTLKAERVLTSAQGATVGVAESTAPLLNFCSNNYLGLSNHPEVAGAAVDALRSHGFGLSSVRFICGTQDLHRRLEDAISAYLGMEDTILYPSCFDANAGLFEALLGPDDAVLSDELNHASIIDGIRLCKAKRFRYRHMDMEDLERQLVAACDAGARIKLVVTDGVFSMDGDVAPLGDIQALARKYGAYTCVDDCHASGFVGPSGRGTPEAYGLHGQVDMVQSTLGKALGGATGGFTSGRGDVVALLRQRARPYLFSNTLAPSVAGASLKVFEILETEGAALCAKLNDNTERFRRLLTDAGFDIRTGSHPIVAVMLGDAALAGRMAADLLAEGVYVVAFSYPVVPKGKARIRVQLSAAHSTEQVDSAAAAFVRVGRAHGVLKP